MGAQVQPALWTVTPDWIKDQGSNKPGRLFTRNISGFLSKALTFLVGQRYKRPLVSLAADFYEFVHVRRYHHVRRQAVAANVSWQE